MQDRNEYAMHTHRITPIRQHYAESNEQKPNRIGLKLALIAACFGLAGALTAPNAKASTIGMHIASEHAATPGAYIVTDSGFTAGALLPSLRAADAVVYAGVGRDVLDLGAARIGIEFGASHQRGRIGGYAVISVRAGGVRLMWSPMTRAAGVAVEF